MEKSPIERLLATENDLYHIAEPDKYVRKMGVSAVPTFIVAGKAYCARRAKRRFLEQCYHRDFMQPFQSRVNIRMQASKISYRELVTLLVMMVGTVAFFVYGMVPALHQIATDLSSETPKVPKRS